MAKKETIKVLYKTPFLSLCQTEHKFYFAERRNINSTAILCFKKVNGKYMFLIRMQPLPLLNTVYRKHWDDLYACPVTGSMEKNQTPIENAINEVYEEANLKISKKDIVASCFTVATTQMNETIFNMLVDVTHARPINKQQGDGTVFETHSKNKWVTYNQLKKILHNDNKKIYLASLDTCFKLFEDKYGKTKN